MSGRGSRIGAHLVLVGLPGAGKSTVGARVAQCLGSDFVDLDSEVERSAGRGVSEIFRDEGERRFRELEREATLTLVHANGRVVSPGGGWIVQPELVALLRPPARIIHLAVSPDTALRRMGAHVADRPLLAGPDPRTALAALWERRREAYATADAVIDTETVDLQQLVEQVAQLATGWHVGVG